MGMKTQGTQLYTIDPDSGELIYVECVTSIDGIDTAIEQNETTCLESLTRTYEAGLATPGAATFGIQVDPRNAQHVRLHQLKRAGAQLKWALGWSDGVDVPPTVDSDNDFILPTTRSWIIFEGYMNSFPFSFQQNTRVSSTVGIQISGEPELIPAVAPVVSEPASV